MRVLTCATSGDSPRKGNEMKTYVYAQHCTQAGKVVIPQPEGKDRKSDDYEAWTLAEARAWRAQVAHTADTHHQHVSARNVIEFRRS